MNSLSQNTTANNNTGVGYRALMQTHISTANVANCAYTLDAITTGTNNTRRWIWKPLYNNTMINVSAVCFESAKYNNRPLNVAVGMRALRDNTEGDRNTALGRESMLVNTTGDYNVAVGCFALDANTTASNNTAIGYNVFCKHHWNCKR